MKKKSPSVKSGKMSASSSNKHPLWHHDDPDCKECHAKRIHSRNKK